MNRRKKILWLATLISLLFHAALFVLLDIIDVLAVKVTPDEELQPSEVEFIFPENKPQENDQPRQVVQNQNFNEQRPQNSNLLSDRNSQARNPERTDQTRENAMFSEGNSPLPDLSNTPFRPPGWKPFSSEALTGKQVSEENKNRGVSQPMQQQDEAGDPSQSSSGSGAIADQRKFSVNEVGALSLSTYAWAYAPYLNKLRDKHQSKWFTPSAYNRLGIISGRTRLFIEIDRQGNLITLEVIDHEGHESLLDASVNSIKATFPFMPLPDDFPDEKLSITATLIYPDLRRRR